MLITSVKPNTMMATRNARIEGLLRACLRRDLQHRWQITQGHCHLLLDSSLRDVKQDDSNNEVAPSRGGEQIDDILDGLVGAVVGDFESAVWAILRIRTAVEAAVGKWSAQPLVEEQK